MEDNMFQNGHGHSHNGRTLMMTYQSNEHLLMMQQPSDKSMMPIANKMANNNNNNNNNININNNNMLPSYMPCPTMMNTHYNTVTTSNLIQQTMTCSTTTLSPPESQITLPMNNKGKRTARYPRRRRGPATTQQPKMNVKAQLTDNTNGTFNNFRVGATVTQPGGSNGPDVLKLPPNLESLPQSESFPSKRLRWNTNEEILSLLLNNAKHGEWQLNEVVMRPESGSMIMYSRKKVRYRRDGYCWKKRKDGKTTREDHMKLKVQGVECIYGCYVHSAVLPTFHRRCYWLLQNPDLVLVHYLNVPYTDETKLVGMLPTIAFWTEKKEWTREELLLQLKPMYENIDLQELKHNEGEEGKTTEEIIESVIGKFMDKHVDGEEEQQKGINIELSACECAVTHECHVFCKKKPIIDNKQLLLSSNKRQKSPITRTKRRRTVANQQNEGLMKSMMTDCIENQNNSTYVAANNSNGYYIHQQQPPYMQQQNQMIYGQQCGLTQAINKVNNQELYPLQGQYNYGNDYHQSNLINLHQQQQQQQQHQHQQQQFQQISSQHHSQQPIREQQQQVDDLVQFQQHPSIEPAQYTNNNNNNHNMTGNNNMNIGNDHNNVHHQFDFIMNALADDFHLPDANIIDLVTDSDDSDNGDFHGLLSSEFLGHVNVGGLMGPDAQKEQSEQGNPTSVEDDALMNMVSPNIANGFNAYGTFMSDSGPPSSGHESETYYPCVDYYDGITSGSASDTTSDSVLCEYSTLNASQDSKSHDSPSINLPILAFSPKWSFTNGGDNMIIVGMWPMKSPNYTVLFGNHAVVADQITSTVLLCQVPADFAVGETKLCVAHNGTVISQSFPFLFVENIGVLPKWASNIFGIEVPTPPELPSSDSDGSPVAGELIDNFNSIMPMQKKIQDVGCVIEAVDAGGNAFGLVNNDELGSDEGFGTENNAGIAGANNDLIAENNDFGVGNGGSANDGFGNGMVENGGFGSKGDGFAVGNGYGPMNQINSNLK